MDVFKWRKRLILILEEEDEEEGTHSTRYPPILTDCQAERLRTARGALGPWWRVNRKAEEETPGHIHHDVTSSAFEFAKADPTSRARRRRRMDFKIATLQIGKVGLDT